MMQFTILNFLLVIGLALATGFAIAWALFQYKFRSKKYLLLEDIEKSYTLKAIHELTQTQIRKLETEYAALQADYLVVSNALAAKEQYAADLKEQLKILREQMLHLQQQLMLQFEQTANKIFSEKADRLTYNNQNQLSEILTPLRERLSSFEQKIEQTHALETEQQISLREEIRLLRTLNAQLSTEAHQLVSALKGDNKVQGDWGEAQLAVLLEKAGLTPDVHFKMQAAFRDADGNMKRPDCLIFLPEQKHLVVDAKVSLKTYTALQNDALDAPTRLVLTQRHAESIRHHAKGLSAKNYQQLYQITTPDFVLMFVPIEAAFTLAAQHDREIFTDALERNVIIVTPATLLATMRTVSYIWRQEKQRRNVQEIARQSGFLYDKFCGFVDDLQEIGKKLNDAQKSYENAMNKLSNSVKHGDTLVGRAKRIKELGAESSKELPNYL